MNDACTVLYTADDVYLAIAHGLIAFDFREDDIGDTAQARVYRDADIMYLERSAEAIVPISSTAVAPWSIQLGDRFAYEEQAFEVAMLGKETAHLRCGDHLTEMPIDALHRLYSEGKLVPDRAPEPSENGVGELLKALTPKDTEEAARRKRLIEAAEGGSATGLPSKRTIQRWKRAVRDSGPSPRDQIAALVSNRYRCGNRNRRLPKEVLDLIAQITRKEFNTPTNITKTAAYDQFVKAARELGLVPCSERSFLAELRRHVSTRSREGKRRAYNEAPTVWYLSATEPIHGVRPLQLVHIDHTQLDLEVVSKSGKRLGKPWLTLAIDAATRRIVGFFLSLRSPSYVSCMMVLRDIVRRFQRMPDMFVLDNGVEFKSKDFKRVAFTFKSHVRYRPAGQPRFGSVMERVFGTLNSQFIHLLKGNTQLMKHVRQVTKSVRPEQFAEWTMTALFAGLEYFFEGVYGRREHPAHGHTPIAYFEERLLETGARAMRWVRFDENFLIETAPTVERGTRAVDSRRGIKIDHLWYWNPRLASGELSRKSIEIRTDPWDVRYVYALVSNSWVKCESRLMASMRCYSIHEFTEAMKEVVSDAGRARAKLADQQIAERLWLLDAKNFESPEAQSDRDLRRVYQGLGMVSPESTPSQSRTPPAAPLESVETTRQPEGPTENADDEDLPLF